MFRTGPRRSGGKWAKQKRKKNVVLIAVLCAYACIAFQLLAVNRIGAPEPSGEEPRVEPWPEPVVYREETFPKPDYEASNPSFAEAWPAMRERLCPNSVPDTELRFALFDLARKEVGISPPSEDGSSVGGWGPIKQFLLRSVFEGTYDGAMLSQYQYERQKSESALSPSQKLGSIIYMIIWKNANIGVSSQLNYYRTMGWLRNIAQVRSLPRGLKRAGYDARDAASRPCIVTAIRDPVSHFLSGYTTVMHRIEHVFPMNFLPSMQGATTSDKKEVFRLFFDRFLNLELRHGMGTWWASGILRHVFPYSRILPILQENGVSLTGYVPTLTNLTSTWPKFLGEVCPNVPSGLRSTGGQHLDYPHNNPDGFQKGANDVWSEGTEYARALCAIHAFDYACWKLPDGVPRACQEMFAKEEFIRAVTE